MREGLSNRHSEGGLGGASVTERAKAEEPALHYMSDVQREAWIAVEEYRRKNPGTSISKACEKTGVLVSNYGNAKRKAVAHTGEALRPYSDKELLRPGDGVLRGVTEKSARDWRKKERIVSPDAPLAKESAAEGPAVLPAESPVAAPAILAGTLIGRKGDTPPPPKLTEQPAPPATNVEVRPAPKRPRDEFSILQEVCDLLRPLSKEAKTRVLASTAVMHGIKGGFFLLESEAESI